MKNNKFILASNSPRRRELLKLLIDDFLVMASNIPEDLDDNLTNEEMVMDLALQKAKDISLKNSGMYVLGFDTLVIVNGLLLGKPNNKEEAFSMLKSLGGRTHSVLTGCAIVKDDYEDVFYECAEVTFAEMSDYEIIEYIETGEPMDKAGAYGIQGFGAKYIEKVNGDFYTVMGLPINKLYKRIKIL